MKRLLADPEFVARNAAAASERMKCLHQDPYVDGTPCQWSIEARFGVMRLRRAMRYGVTRSDAAHRHTLGQTPSPFFTESADTPFAPIHILSGSTMAFRVDCPNWSDAWMVTQ